MEDLQKDQTLDGPDGRVIERRRLPTFLVTIAILTFVGSFLSLIRCVFTIVAMGFLGSISKSIGQNMGSEVDNFFNWTIIGCYSGILTALFSSLGAGLMLRRKVTGYWIYMASQIIYIAVTALVAIGMSGKHLGIVEIVSNGFLILAAAAFCIMYTLNKKHLGELRVENMIEI